MKDERLCAELKLLRKRHGLSFRAMEKLVGVSFVHLNRIENGRAEPTIGILLKIAKALDSRLVVKFVDRS